MPTIEYERDDGIESIERSDVHTEKDGYVVGVDTDGEREKVTIPKDRVVIIRG